MRVESVTAVGIKLGRGPMAKIGVQDSLTVDLLTFQEGIPHGDMVIHGSTREVPDRLHALVYE